MTNLLFLTALPAEARIVTARLADRQSGRTPFPHWTGTWRRRSAVVVQSGLGPDRAEQAARWAIEAFEPEHALVVGFAGALSAVLGVGQIVIADQILPLAGPAIPTTPLEIIRADAKSRSRVPGGISPDVPLPDCNATTGAILSVDVVISTPQWKADLHARTGALAVDMESHAIASACRDHAVPLTVVRAVSDDATTTIPLRLARCLHPDGRLRIAYTAIAFCNPSLWPIAWRLARGSSAARRSLETLVDSL